MAGARTRWKLLGLMGGLCCAASSFAQTTGAPILLTANWKADSARWVIPFGAGVGKNLKLGRQPLNGSVSAYYNAVRPDGAPDWQLRAQLAFLFPEGKPKSSSSPP
ncbi:hypothetical protein OV208_37745 [Corallococcus sp. bb12-1]|uniref:hypothetical protein n=1 Tax=Corallococcus sp. bb12-1 TaxID=2996784 RepID=UPI0022703CDF|nr:hypothetical protein [Corallococcus sp. bb12-1]MCY1047107.1 hypothetical protein [Corallococcus sp. bb12-1]